jgi:hypothetical protein
MIHLFNTQISQSSTKNHSPRIAASAYTDSVTDLFLRGPAAAVMDEMYAQVSEASS